LLGDAWQLTALSSAIDRARSLGINLRAVRVRALLIVSLLTAPRLRLSARWVRRTGAPHIGRMMVGEDQRYLIPMSALCGAGLLSAASVASKSIVPGAIFPIGIRHGVGGRAPVRCLDHAGEETVLVAIAARGLTAGLWRPRHTRTASTSTVASASILAVSVPTDRANQHWSAPSRLVPCSAKLSSKRATFPRMGQKPAHWLYASGFFGARRTDRI